MSFNFQEIHFFLLGVQRKPLFWFPLRWIEIFFSSLFFTVLALTGCVHVCECIHTTFNSNFSKYMAPGPCHLHLNTEITSLNNSPEQIMLITLVFYHLFLWLYHSFSCELELGYFIKYYEIWLQYDICYIFFSNYRYL